MLDEVTIVFLLEEWLAEPGPKLAADEKPVNRLSNANPRQENALDETHETSGPQEVMRVKSSFVCLPRFLLLDHLLLFRQKIVLKREVIAVPEELVVAERKVEEPDGDTGINIPLLTIQIKSLQV